MMRQLGVVCMLALGIGTAIAQEAQTSSFETIDADTWEHRDTAMQWISELGENQSIRGGVVSDPDEPGVYYFATSMAGTADDGSGNSTLSIYRYQADGQLYWRPWREDHIAGDVEGMPADVLPEWHVIGHDNNQVIFLETTADYDHGECGEGLVRGMDGTDGSSLLALPDTYDQSWTTGPTAYTPVDADITSARDRQTQCEQDGGGETGGGDAGGDTGEDTDQQPEDTGSPDDFGEQPEETGDDTDSGEEDTGDTSGEEAPQ